MGIVASVTPSMSSQRLRVSKSKESVNIKDLSSSKNIKITQYVAKAVHPSSVKLKPLDDLSEALSLRRRHSEVLDLTWIANWIVKPIFPKSCNWSGYMQANFFDDKHYDVSSVLMLPMIDLSPSDPTCIYSTLLFVRDQATALGIRTPCLTFDQPLWFKANAITEEKKLDVICRLGGFHLLMSFLGSVGHLMGGSGLEELLHEVYALH